MAKQRAANVIGGKTRARTDRPINPLGDFRARFRVRFNAVACYRSCWDGERVKQWPCQPPWRDVTRRPPPQGLGPIIGKGGFVFALAKRSYDKVLPHLPTTH